jgi:hypothetical protein
MRTIIGVGVLGVQRQLSQACVIPITFWNNISFVKSGMGTGYALMRKRPYDSLDGVPAEGSLFFHSRSDSSPASSRVRLRL